MQIVIIEDMESQVEGRHSHKAILLVGIMFLFGSLLMFAGCKAAVNPPPPVAVPDVIPQKADLLGSINIAEVIDDDILTAAYLAWAGGNSDKPPTWDDALDSIESDTGVDLRDFSSIIMFADAQSVASCRESGENVSMPYFGVVAEGNLSESVLVDSIESKLGQELITTDYHGYAIYNLPPLDAQDGSISMVFLADGRVVFGDSVAVTDVIDVVRGVHPSISGTAGDLYSKLGDVPIRLVTHVPSSVTDEIPPEIPLGPTSLSLLSFHDIEYLALSLMRKQDVVHTVVSLEFSNSDSAKTSYQMMWVAQKAGKYITDDPDVEGLLSRVHLSRSESSVFLTVDMIASELSEIVDVLSAKSQ